MSTTSHAVKAIITGHTHGLGAALAAACQRARIPVLGLARGQAAHAGAALREKQIDLSDVQALQQWLGAPDLTEFLAGCATVLLLNNAGMVQPVGALADQDPAEVARAVTLNVAAPLMLAAAVVRIMQGRQTRIVHVSSGAGRSAYPGWSVYCATKAALDHHARALALDGSPGVRACSLAPGVIDTAMQAQIRATPDERFPMRQRFVELKRDGVLVSPAACAEKLLAFALDADFGQEPVADLRG